MSAIHLDEIRVEVRNDQVVPLDTLVVAEQLRTTPPEVIARAVGLEKRCIFSLGAFNFYMFLFIVLGSSFVCIILGATQGYASYVLYTVGYFLLGMGVFMYAVLVFVAWCSGYEAKEIFCVCRRDWDAEEFREAKQRYREALQQ